MDEVNIDILANNEFILVTGISDSSYLVEFLKSKAFNFKHLKYSDHYNFNKLSIEKIRSLSLGKKILTTEKILEDLNQRLAIEISTSLKYQCILILKLMNSILMR